MSTTKYEGCSTHSRCCSAAHGCTARTRSSSWADRRSWTLSRPPSSSWTASLWTQRPPRRYRQELEVQRGSLKLINMTQGNESKQTKQTQSDWEWKHFNALFKEMLVLSLSGVFLQQLCNYCLSQNSMEVYKTSKVFSVVSKGNFNKNWNVNCFSLIDF